MAILDKTEYKKPLEVTNTQSPTITSTTLAPTTPISLPPTPTATQTVGLGAALEAQTSTFTSGLQEKAKSSEKTKETALEALLKNTLTTPGEVALTDKAYSKTVDPLEAELKDINQQMLEEQVSLRRRIEAIEKNPEGKFAGAIEQDVAKATKESIAKQADLAVIQLSRQGRYDSAKAIADRAVAAKLEEQKTKNDALKLIYEENKDAFDKDEQRAFEAQQSERERALDKEEADSKQISDLSLDALQNGAPSDVASRMRQAQSVDEAIRIGGQYIGALDRRYKIAQINKLGLENLAAEAEANDTKNGILTQKDIQAIDNSPQGKKLQTASDLKLKLSTYQNLVNEFGFETVGTNKAALENAYTELQLAYKEAANLGVLNGPDLGLVEKAIKSATPGLLGNFGNILSLGQSSRNLSSNLEQAQSTLNNAAALNLEQLYARNPSYQDSLYVKSLILPFGEEILLSSEKKDMDAVLNR